MITRSFGKSRYGLTYLISIFLVSLLIFNIFLAHPGMNRNYKATFPDLVYGRAYKPYVFRVLLPAATRTIVSLIPQTEKSKIEENLKYNTLLNKLFAYYEWKNHLVEHLIGSSLIYLSLLGFIFSIKYFFTGIFQTSRWFSDIVPLIALLGLPIFFKYTNYPYDMPGIFLFTMILGLMIRQKWKFFILVFLAGCLNKETTILSTLIFFIYFFKNPKINKSLFWKLIIIQIFLFSTIKITLSLIFKNNPGGLVEFNLFHQHNINLLTHPSFSLIATCFLFLIIALLISYKWSEKPKFLKNAIWIIIPLFILVLFFAWWDEWRDFYEVYPIIIGLSMHSISKILGIRIKNIID